MRRVIQILRTTPSMETGFSTVEEAIASVRHGARNQVAQKHSATLAGHRFVYATWQPEKVRLVSDNGYVLVIEPEYPLTTWCLEPWIQAENPPAGDTDTWELAVLERDGNIVQSHPWAAGKLLSERLGKPIRQLFAGNAWMYVYVEGMLALVFVAAQSYPSGLPILHWFETP